MTNALLVFNALRSFARPATLAELERESGLDRDQVHKALKTLGRHQLLVKDCSPRQRGLYQLIDNAAPPETWRGRYQRDAAHRARGADSVRAHYASSAHAHYSPARPPSHAAAPGALRATVSKLAASSMLCALATPAGPHRRAAPVAFHGRRLRRCDAQDVADELIELCQRAGMRCALFVLPDGQCQIAYCNSAAFAATLIEHPRALCGVYTADADRGDLVADIRARCEMIGLEWFDA